LEVQPPTLDIISGLQTVNQFVCEHGTGIIVISARRFRITNNMNLKDLNSLAETFLDAIGEYDSLITLAFITIIAVLLIAALTVVLLAIL
jgi:hypothetical protein